MGFAMDREQPPIFHSQCLGQCVLYGQVTLREGNSEGLICGKCAGLVPTSQTSQCIVPHQRKEALQRTSRMAFDLKYSTSSSMGDAF